MKRITCISLLFSCTVAIQAQVSFKTIAPQQAIVVGQSFQLQYTISNAEKVSSFKAPAFIPFRFVSGPDLYTGSEQGVNGDMPVRNYGFTLEAVKQGRFVIQGALAIVNGKQAHSDPVVIEVISDKEAVKREDAFNNSARGDHMLLPGEDPFIKIKQNLFLKITVDRTSCFVGEPVLATFKLYSRLESKSDIIKNPGFYGFTVYDMVNLTDNEMTSENINDKLFDVHTIRKVQLYPLRTGAFTIDAMEVKNKVEFSKSSVNKKTEQQITEGNHDEEKGEKTDIYENTISTTPVTISVKPLPLKNKLDLFDGAVGNFAVSSRLEKKVLAKNEENVFEVFISGTGNFTQLNAPIISWPPGIEGFEAVTSDSLDKTKLPLAGKRVFRYTFISSRPGNYELPPVNFNFFNPDAAVYKTVSTSATHVEVKNEEKKTLVIPAKKTNIGDINAKASRIAGLIILSLIAAGLLYWIFKKKEEEKLPVTEKIPEQPSVEIRLQSVDAAMEEDGSHFYSILHNVIWKFVADKFDLPESETNKTGLEEVMNKKNINNNAIQSLLLVIEECEIGVYTQVQVDGSRVELLEKVKELFEIIRSDLFKQV